MKKIYLSLLFIVSLISARAQFNIGHVSVTYNDPDRNNRAITTEIFYPAESAGDDVELSAGVFPYVVFGHGFVMNYDAYENIWEYLVPEGYILVFPTTETGLPSHENFGLDLVFLMNHMMEEGNNASSLFYGHVSDKQAIMGHSMGGGATWLAAAQTGEPECIVGLAPAETNPSAIAAASNVELPVMVFSGSSDNVTPPDEHHIPIYDASASACKYFVNLVSGSHCGYADSGSLCDLGEIGFSGMNRATQQEHMHFLLENWLDHFLYDDASALQELESYDDSNDDVEINISCITDVRDLQSAGITCWPQPCRENLWIRMPHADEWLVEIFDMAGRLVLQKILVTTSSQEVKDLNIPQTGMYTLQISSSNGSEAFRQVILSE